MTETKHEPGQHEDGLHKHVRHSSALRWGAIAAFAVAIGLLAFLGIRRSQSVKQDRERLVQQKAEGLPVQTVHIQESPPVRQIRLIGDIRPYAAVTLYAKVSGYMRTIFVDKGQHVDQGQLLAIIESPETDKAYNGALAQAINTRRIAKRYHVLERSGLVSHQEAEQVYTNSDVAKAQLETQATLKSYEYVRAPFSGTITDRYVDPGQLIQNGADSTSALALVSVSDLDRLRIYCYVNQSDAPYVHPGDPATIDLRERPNTDFLGRVTRISGQLDPKTRMMLAEIDMTNEQRLIVPGSYSEVRLQVAKPPLMIAPTEALVRQKDQDFVIAVSRDRRAVFKPIRLADNNGLEIEISAGVQNGDEVVINPPEQIRSGSVLQPRSVDRQVSTNVQRAGQVGKEAGSQLGGPGMKTGTEVGNSTHGKPLKEK